jgi:hypothetical protein
VRLDRRIFRRIVDDPRAPSIAPGALSRASPRSIVHASEHARPARSESCSVLVGASDDPIMIGSRSFARDPVPAVAR